MPWQQYVADVLMEIDPETGGLWYTEGGLEVPRQSGKSTFILGKATHRCTATGFFGPRQRVVYTAQTRQKAREKWDEDYRAELESSATFNRMARTFKGSGNEHFRFQNGSRWGIDANTEKAGHGGTLDEAYIDEAFAQTDARLEQAFRPAMITRDNKQLLWISTAGWLGESPFLEAKTERGRAAVLNPESRLAYFEWSAPEDADPVDPETWRACMPALGHTISEASIGGELDGMDLPDFRRAYLNQWVPKPVDKDVAALDPIAWTACADPESSAVDPVSFGIDVNDERSWACIAVGGRRADGRPHGAVVDYSRGVEWVVDRAVELQRKWQPLGFVVDPSSPAGSLIPELDARGVRVIAPTRREIAQTCGALYDFVTQGVFRHRGEAALDISIRSARQRAAGDAWVFERRGQADVAPLLAMTLALRPVLAVSVPLDDAALLQTFY